MKAYAQFYEERNGVMVEPCGSFALIILDARMSVESMKDVAAYHCNARKYDAYRVYRGNLKNATALTPITVNKYGKKGAYGTAS